MSVEKKVRVTVEYVGNEPFVESMSEKSTLHAVKHKAMDQFELEPSSADKYVLEHGGAMLNDEKTKLETFRTREVLFTLLLKKETEKG